MGAWFAAILVHRKTLTHSRFRIAEVKFLAHRGLWYQPDERNQPEALRIALAQGFGLETDVRDAVGQLVIAHDPPIASAQPMADFLALYGSIGSTAPLALNIKADGLRIRLKSLLEEHQVKNYFCFDMSVPETLAYCGEGLRYFTRESEYEPHPPLYDDAAGVWMDMFHNDWITREHIVRHLDAGKQVAIVSPELHRRAHERFWERLRQDGLARYPGVMLCTDFPESARGFFI